MKLSVTIPQRLILESLLNTFRDPDESKLEVAEKLLETIRTDDIEKTKAGYSETATGGGTFKLTIPGEDAREFQVTAEEASLVKDMIKRVPKTITDKNTWYKPLISQL